MKALKADLERKLEELKKKEVRMDWALPLLLKTAIKNAIDQEEILDIAVKMEDKIKEHGLSPELLDNVRRIAGSERCASVVARVLREDCRTFSEEKIDTLSKAFEAVQVANDCCKALANMASAYDTDREVNLVILATLLHELEDHISVLLQADNSRHMEKILKAAIVVRGVENRFKIGGWGSVRGSLEKMGYDYIKSATDLAENARALIEKAFPDNFFTRLADSYNTVAILHQHFIEEIRVISRPYRKSQRTR